MTVQPSAEALHVAETFVDTRERWHKLARRIDTLCEQRVSAETVRWQNRDRQRLEQISALQAAVQSFQSAPAERPAPEGPQQSGDIVRWGVLRLLSGDFASDEEKVDAELDLDDFQFWFQENPKHTGFKQLLINLSGEQWGKLKELPLVEERSPQPPSALASTGEQPACPAAVVDYTEQARVIAIRWVGPNAKGAFEHPNFPERTDACAADIAAALSAVASEREARPAMSEKGRS